MGLRGFLLDITDLKRTEEALRTSEVRYRYYIEHVNDGVFCFKPVEPIDLGLPHAEKVEQSLNAICVECNETFALMGVLEREKIIGRSIKRLASDLESYKNLLSWFFKQNCRLSNFEIHDIDPKGISHWYQTSLFGEVENGKLILVWGNMIDITERRKAHEALQQANRELAEAYNATLEGWSRALEMRERETAGHSLRVVDLTLQLAKALGVRGEKLQHIRRGALLHDIGKMGIPDSILLKPSSLSEDEWVVMRQHPLYANELTEAHLLSGRGGGYSLLPPRTLERGGLPAPVEGRGDPPGGAYLRRGGCVRCAHLRPSLPAGLDPGCRVAIYPRAIRKTLRPSRGGCVLQRHREQPRPGIIKPSRCDMINWSGYAGSSFYF